MLSSNDRAHTILAAGCCTSICFRMVAPSLVIITSFEGDTIYSATNAGPGARRISDHRGPRMPDFSPTRPPAQPRRATAPTATGGPVVSPASTAHEKQAAYHLVHAARAQRRAHRIRNGYTPSPQQLDTGQHRSAPARRIHGTPWAVRTYTWRP